MKSTTSPSGPHRPANVTTVPTTTPAGWLNWFMKVFLRTPGLQRVIGRSVALITFHGRRTSRTYTTPVSYRRQGVTVIILSRASRIWWRNFAANPHVTLRLAGYVFAGVATASVGSEDDLETVVAFLARRKLDARAYGVSLGPDGEPSRPDVRRLLPHLVVIRVVLEERPSSTRRS